MSLAREAAVDWEGDALDAALHPCPAPPLAPEGCNYFLAGGPRPSGRWALGNGLSQSPLVG